MQLGSGNGTSFPTSVDTATTEVNSPASGKTKARAEVVNDLLSAVVAIETSLQDGTGFIKYPSVQRVVTGSRTLGTAYRNDTGRPMTVNVNALCSSSGDILAKTDSATTPTTIVDQVTLSTGARGTVRFVVLPGNYYFAVMFTGSATLNTWVEWY